MSDSSVPTPAPETPPPLGDPETATVAPEAKTGAGRTETPDAAGAAVPAGERAPAAAGAPEDAAPAPGPEAGAEAWAEHDAEAEPAAEAGAEEPAPALPPEADADDDTPVRAATERAKAKQSAEARARALEKLAGWLPRDASPHAAWVVEALERGFSPVFLARFRREKTGGLDEGRLLDVRDAWRKMRVEEERRVVLRDLLQSRGAMNEGVAARLESAQGVPAMEDLAAPWLPVTASRATVARGMGLQGLADAIRAAKEPQPLSELSKPFVKEGGPVATFDAALAGARDILAEEACLDPVLRARLRELFRRRAVLTVSLRPERKGDVGRHGQWVGYSAPAGSVPPLKLLAVRRGERERVLQSTVEPPEADAIALVHGSVAASCGESHPHGGFLRAAAEDGYRRILRPLLQSEARTEMKLHADGAAIETFERSLRNLLLGPVGGMRPTLGVQPDVTGGHRVGAVDARGRTVYAGRLPHEATAGREAAVAAARALLEAHAVEAVAVGAAAGRKEATATFVEAARELGREVVVTEVPDGGTRALESAAVAKPVQTESGVEIPPECQGALSLARRFQDPMAEYVRIDPKVLGLGPNLHDVHQGRLKEVLDDAVASCVAHAGVDATTADAELLARVPGLDRARAKAFTAWRDAGGKLAGKAAIAAVDGVGPAAAEQAVGFVRVPGTGDPRDRTQLHPEQYGLLEEMASQVGADVVALFQDGRLRARVDLGKLARPEAPLPTLKYVLWQATTGLLDPRPRFTAFTKPPPDVTLQTIRPGLLLEGRVTRAVPFGVFVDVGLGAEALVPLPHLGDRPGVDPATIAPVGAVIHGRVLEIDVPKRRITLSMRSDREERRDGPPPRGRAPQRGRGDGPPRRGDGPPRRDAFPVGVGAPAGERPPGGPPAGGGRPARGGERGPGRFEGRGGGGGGRGPDARPGAGAGAGARPGAGGRTGGGAPPGGSRASGQPRVGGGMGGGGKRRDEGRPERDDFGAPRRISLPMDAAPPAPEAVPEETALTPEQLLAKKIEEMKKKLTRGG